MRVLITGADGYIGAVLAPTLLERGIDVVGLDCGYYRDGWLYNDARPRPLTLTKDIRHITPKDVEGFDAVVHLAELSNDPFGEHNASTTYDINHRGSVKSGQGLQAGRDCALRLYLLLQRLWRGRRRRRARREIRDPAADRLRQVQAAGRARCR